MIYLYNNTEQQEVWISRNDGLGFIHTGTSGSYQEGFEDGEAYQKSLLTTTAFTENGEYSREDGWSAVTVDVNQTTATLEEKSVTISADTTVVLPSSGFDGMSAVTVDASQYAQDNYDNGFDDGFDDGYASGSTEGYEEGVADQKSRLSTTAFTENGNYSRENGWSGITVNIDTASTYNSGYTSGYTSGHTDGSNEEKAKLSATTFTANTVVTLSDGGYSAVTVNVPQTGYTQQDLDDAYASGETHQKSLLSTTALTENGSYTRENGWSGVTVNVDTASTYNSGYTDGFDSGYTSGETHQKDLLATTAFTNNGTYTRQDGWSGVSVNVDTASTYQSGYTSGHTDGVDEEKAKLSAATFTANTAVTLNDGGYSAVTVNLDTASTYNTGFNDGFVAGENTIVARFTAATATTNGHYGSVQHPLSSITVNVPQTGSTAVLGVGSFSANGTYSASTDNLDGYSAITINVSGSSSGPKFIEYIGINNPSRNTCYFELGNTGTGLNSKIVIEHSTLSKENTGSDWESWLMFYDGDRGRIFVENGTAPVQFDGRYNKSSLPYTAITDETIVLEYSGVTVGNSSFNMPYNPSEVSNCNNMVVFAAYGSGFFTTPGNQLKYGRIGTISIYDSANTLTYQYKPCLDENNVICFYEVVNDVYVYPNNGGDTYLYSGPVINEMYESGYTDGQNSIISTFTAMTATTNGVYGSSAHPLSSITVNVPQSAYDINVLAKRNYNFVNQTITASTIEESAFGGCTGITGSLELGSSVWTIKKGAFCGSSISEIIWPQYIDGGVFSVTAMTMRDGLQFAECPNLVSVEVPDYVTFSGNSISSSSGMFYSCINLVDVEFYAKRIPENCFRICNSLEYIYIENITSIGQGAFYGCTNLTEIRFAQQHPPTVSYYAFDYVPSGGTLYVPSGRSSVYSQFVQNYLSNWTIVEDE